MADGFDFVIETTNGRVDISEEFVTEGDILAECFLQFFHLNVRVVELRDQPDC